ncbi:MAG: biotin--[acetyl-CoA-carboxylase] ligase [Kaistella sp.]
MPALIFLKECNSTNEEILKYLNPEKSDYQAVYTFNQTNGRGQYGNSWECEANLNLAFTLAVPAQHFETQDHLLNFRTAIILADFLANMTKSRVEIKWPNDIIIKNKKISGILTEKKNVEGTPFFIIGVGLNILQENFEHLPKAGSLLTQTGMKLEPEKIANLLFEELSENLRKPFSAEELFRRINQNLFRKDKVSVFELKGLRQNGIIKKVDEAGYLWVDLENQGLQKFYNKEIELLY